MLVVNIIGITVIAASNAVVQPAAASAAIVGTSPVTYFTIKGRVDGSSKHGLLVSVPDMSTSFSIVVAAGGVLTGSQGLLVQGASDDAAMRIPLSGRQGAGCDWRSKEGPVLTFTSWMSYPKEGRWRPRRATSVSP